MTRLSRRSYDRRPSPRMEIECLESRVVPSASPVRPFLASSGCVHQAALLDVNDTVVFSNPAGPGTTASSGPVFPLSSVPQLSSLPGAKASIYLNFTGDFTPSWGGFNNITTRCASISNKADYRSTVNSIG